MVQKGLRADEALAARPLVDRIYLISVYFSLSKAGAGRSYWMCCLLIIVLMPVMTLLRHPFLYELFAFPVLFTDQRLNVP